MVRLVHWLLTGHWLVPVIDQQFKNEKLHQRSAEGIQRKHTMEDLPSDELHNEGRSRRRTSLLRASVDPTRRDHLQQLLLKQSARVQHVVPQDEEATTEDISESLLDSALQTKSAILKNVTKIMKQARRHFGNLEYPGAYLVDFLASCVSLSLPLFSSRQSKYA